ncbi:hypothetical protein ACDY97_30150 [Rhizobium mongolense]|uniref:hypothetical protein n=1 Tax=Rhizobium mongolense TaxID=57676 RepID=UPI003556A03C
MRQVNSRSLMRINADKGSPLPAFNHALASARISGETPSALISQASPSPICASSPDDFPPSCTIKCRIFFYSARILSGAKLKTQEVCNASLLHRATSLLNAASREFADDKGFKFRAPKFVGTTLCLLSVAWYFITAAFSNADIALLLTSRRRHSIAIMALHPFYEKLLLNHRLDDAGSVRNSGEAREVRIAFGTVKHRNQAYYVLGEADFLTVIYVCARYKQTKFWSCLEGKIHLHGLTFAERRQLDTVFPYVID